MTSETHSTKGPTPRQQEFLM